MSQPLVDVERELARLKDFQRRTVDRAFERLYAEGGSGRFLVADEVGLGKTLVARGIVAKTIDRLQRSGVRRIDIIYICSNSAIARQNVKRINVLEKGAAAMATRLTLLPTLVQNLSGRPVNFISFTPGTTFDLKSRAGWASERVVLHRMLQNEPDLDRKGLLNILQGSVGRKNWKARVRDFDEAIDADLERAFRAKLRTDPAFWARLSAACGQFQEYKERREASENELRKEIVGELRRRLAETCLGALEPDLVILDEFQRFRDLLDASSEDEAAMLAQALFRYEGVRILLLSATPYRMLTLNDEQEEDHYSDFMRTLTFLMNDPASREAVDGALQTFRRSLFSASAAETGGSAAREELSGHLRAVMSRTERVGMTNRLDAMLADVPSKAPLFPADLAHAAAVDRAARAVGAPDTIDYWKSSPYLLNFLRGYSIRQKIEDVLDAPPEELIAAIIQAGGHSVKREQVEAYEKLDPGNARMRILVRDTLDRGLWRLLWMPPSLPYTEPRGHYADVGDVSKVLLFSHWNLVPDAVASIMSYEAERLMLDGLKRNWKHSELYDHVKPLLRFSKGAEGRLTGMPALALLQPSPSLVTLVDPLRRALELGGGGPVPAERILVSVERQVSELLRELPEAQSTNPDQRWYWAAPALLDARRFPGVLAWCVGENGWLEAFAGEDEEAGTGFREHLDQLVQAMEGRLVLGRKPDDLARVIAELAIGSPGTVALRALRRSAPELPLDDSVLLSSATRAANGLRSLFNVPETIGLLRGSEAEDSYWRLVVRYGIDGNIQAVLDEQVHILTESLGLVDDSPGDRVNEISEVIASAAQMRIAQLRVDEIRVRGDGRRIGIDQFNTRCRFALRFGELRDEQGTEVGRPEAVRNAFNSPFRPFVLASTSIGQEGLDFHLWCHAVMHWNLPSNPVDLEQREGRVHRYKGYAVRKNVARRFGLGTLASIWNGEGDPWQALFTHAAATRASGTSDLVPYWLYEIEGGATVERRIPLIPFSKEVDQLHRLRKSLALYRLVFGQPRQEDLLYHLTQQMTEEQARRAALEWRISLAP